MWRRRMMRIEGGRKKWVREKRVREKRREKWVRERRVGEAGRALEPARSRASECCSTSRSSH